MANDEWVNVRVSSIMNDSNDCLGRTERGLEFYLKMIIAQNDKMIDILSRMRDEMYSISNRSR